MKPQEVSKSNANKTNKNKTDISKTDINNSFLPFVSLHEEKQKPKKEGRERKKTFLSSDVCLEHVKENIGYEYLIQRPDMDTDRLDELVEIIREVLCSKKQQIRISGNDIPADIVKERFSKLEETHIEFVFSCLRANTSKIKNIKQYLVTVLYNAPVTMANATALEVQYDLRQ